VSDRADTVGDKAAALARTAGATALSLSLIHHSASIVFHGYFYYLSFIALQATFSCLFRLFVIHHSASNVFIVPSIICHSSLCKSCFRFLWLFLLFLIHYSASNVCYVYFYTSSSITLQRWLFFFFFVFFYSVFINLLFCHSNSLGVRAAVRSCSWWCS
jgi:hypothetical protein